jgi:ferrochelatase
MDYQLLTEPSDAVLLIGFGGPTSMAEVRPFLDNVLRGRPVPPERIEAVVHHYEIIGGRSPFNELTFRQARALEAQLRAEGLALPVYVGMRTWTPYVQETLQQMAADSVRRAVGIIMAPHQTEASWGRYERAVSAARARLGAVAPDIDYVDPWHAHPLFIEAVSDNAGAALQQIPSERRTSAALVFTAHSVPTAMAAASPYVAQITESARLVAERSGHPQWTLAYQSRSGNPSEPWLDPDINEVVRQLAGAGARDVVVAPIGFVCDHVEVLYDLDIETHQLAQDLGLNFVRAATVNDHPTFVRMLADVVRQRVHAASPTSPAQRTQVPSPLETVDKREPHPSRRSQNPSTRRSAPAQEGPPQGERKLSFENNNRTARPEEPASSGGVSKGARWRKSTVPSPEGEKE